MCAASALSQREWTDMEGIAVWMAGAALIIASAVFGVAVQTALRLLRQPALLTEMALPKRLTRPRA